MEDRGFDLDGRLDALINDDLRRRLAPVDRAAERAYFAAPPDGELPVIDADDALVFGSNNYLGLTFDRRVQNAARQAATTVGTGAGASRLATGDTIVHHDLERLVAETKGTDRALAFSSGYAANTGTIAALDPDVVFSDEHSHESIADGCRLSGSDVERYDHCDVASLDETLAKRASHAGSDDESWLVVTDSVFGTDGTVAPLSELCELAEEYGAWMMVDEAHATGLYANGGGVVQAEGLEDRIQIQMGTLSTALASQGGYIAGSDALIECLVNDASSFVHSTGLAPSATAAASEALHIARHGDCRERLWENVNHLRDGLTSMGYEVGGDSHILPVVVDERADALALAEALRERRIVAPAVHPSRAPGETGGIRVTPMATHKPDEITACLEAFQKAGETVGLL